MKYFATLLCAGLILSGCDTVDSDTLKTSQIRFNAIVQVTDNVINVEVGMGEENEPDSSVILSGDDQLYVYINNQEKTFERSSGPLGQHVYQSSFAYQTGDLTFFLDRGEDAVDAQTNIQTVHNLSSANISINPQNNNVEILWPTQSRTNFYLTYNIYCDRISPSNIDDPISNYPSQLSFDFQKTHDTDNGQLILNQASFDELYKKTYSDGLVVHYLAEHYPSCDVTARLTRSNETDVDPEFASGSIESSTEKSFTITRSSI